MSWQDYNFHSNYNIFYIYKVDPPFRATKTIAHNKGKGNNK